MHAQPARTATLRPVRPAVPLPPPPKPVRRAPAGTLVAYVRSGRTVAVRSAPSGPVVAQLSSRTQFGSPRTFAATPAAHGLHVITTELPNGRTGWVDAHGALRLSRTTVSLDVDLSSRLLRVRVADRLARTMRVGIGASGTSTPTGRFAITDKLRGSAYSSVYGCCVLALSGHQTRLPLGWSSGDRLAIHGGGGLGSAVSAGCVHAREKVLRYLMQRLPLGTLVRIEP